MNENVETNVVVIGYDTPLEKRLMLADINYLEELDKNHKYEFWFDHEIQKWMIRKRLQVSRNDK